MTRRRMNMRWLSLDTLHFFQNLSQRERWRICHECWKHELSAHMETATTVDKEGVHKGVRGSLLIKPGSNATHVHVSPKDQQGSGKLNVKPSWEVVGNQVVKRYSVRDLWWNSRVLCLQYSLLFLCFSILLIPRRCWHEIQDVRFRQSWASCLQQFYPILHPLCGHRVRTIPSPIQAPETTNVLAWIFEHTQ